jgi:hypothetical protein
MDDRSYMHAVMPVIRWIDDLQEKRQRPVVFISMEAACDAFGKPRSSVQKAFRRLIESYQVYLVNSADFNHRGEMADVLSWAEQYFDAPAYNHVILTCQKHLLLGDYLIDTVPCDNFMGTVIPFGSETFKTWEEVITFFDRLGGQ